MHLATWSLRIRSRKEKCNDPLRVTTLRIDSRPSFYPLHPHAAQQTRHSSRPSPLQMIFRPLFQPFIRHRFVRPAQQQYNQQNRRWDAPATGNRTASSGYYDATQRSDDPHISKINKQSFDKQRAVEQLTQGTSKWQDWNRNGKTEISYHFKNDRDGSFNETQKQEARRSIQSWSDVANLAFTENGRLAEGRLSFRISNNETAAQGFYPSPNADGGDTVYNPSFVARPVITHEIGHTLGLTHPGHYNGQASEEQRVYAQDSKPIPS
ncbi:hypothetical protein SAMN04515675_3663 [Pseudomonas costantinii]|uniref:Peptidase metallopeptidase domain-containing protein n=2 Tax=Pseudomonas costantinii TaxID=168469 RepID=A0A1H5FKA9_9PSED|nr:hypothetical protein SAMN04515675_3663 [Pseudomonas costantinii]